MKLSAKEADAFLYGLSCDNCIERQRCKDQQAAKEKTLDFYFNTICQKGNFSDEFIKEFRNAIPKITRCDLVYEKLLNKLKGE